VSAKTSIGGELNAELLKNYFHTLVNQVYKILPMREKETESLGKYIWRLEAELIGGYGLIEEVQNDSYYGSLLNILHYLNEHGSECPVEQVKQLVFEGIGICEKLSRRYAEDGE